MTSPDLVRALSASHVLVTTVQSRSALNRGLSIPFESGTIDVDGSRAVRRTLSLIVPDPRWLPQDADDVLSPYSGELTVRQGVQFPDGTVETAPLGVFRVEEASGDERTGPVTVIGHSLETVVLDDRFEFPRQVGGSGCVETIRTLITESYPSASFSVDPTLSDRSCPTITEDEDRWGLVEQIATALGAEVYCDAEGVFRIWRVPDPATATPVATISAGPGGTLKSIGRSYSRDGVFNAVTARSTAINSDTPVQGSAVDDDPSSPTRYGGPFRKVRKYYGSPLLLTVFQCQLAARTILLKSIGLTRSVQFEAVPRPDLDAGQAVRLIGDPVNQPQGEIHILESFPVRLTPGGRAWTAKTRTTTTRPY